MIGPPRPLSRALERTSFCVGSARAAADQRIIGTPVLEELRRQNLNVPLSFGHLSALSDDVVAPSALLDGHHPLLSRTNCSASGKVQ